MKEPYGEGLASHTGSESCAHSRKAGSEALTGAHAGGVLSRDMSKNQSADDSKYGSKRCLGRTEADRKIMSEPWSSMQQSKRTRKTTLRSEWRSVLKKDLTGPTLLEISDFPCKPALSLSRDRFGVVLEAADAILD
jgi:hypothetical protein